MSEMLAALPTAAAAAADMRRFRFPPRALDVRRDRVRLPPASPACVGAGAGRRARRRRAAAGRAIAIEETLAPPVRRSSTRRAAAPTPCRSRRGSPSRLERARATTRRSTRLDAASPRCIGARRRGVARHRVGAARLPTELEAWGACRSPRLTDRFGTRLGWLELTFRRRASRGSSPSR